ncbi:MAG: hypothetical protein B6D36_00680 [Planctomycetes bacterium UTPLA1]|nr:MAG: hypothetical protein B6D36_00680 [Planctomycetes bacterium UTPLA1]
MGSPLDEVLKLPRSNGLSAQTNRALIEHGEHATIQKLPVAAPEGPGNTKGKTTSQVLQEFTGKTPEQMKAEQDARNKALFEKRGLKYPPQ